jgi:guanylate kinase
MGRGKLILIIGSTGSGKGTLMRHALARFPDIASPQSYTTRPRRADAVENTHYTFISEEEFKEKIAEGAFLEWAQFSGHYYGTLRAEIEQGLAEGRVMFKEMEVQGVRQTKQLLPKSELVTAFIEAGSWEELKARALARGPLSDTELELRRKRYEDELTFMPEADVIIHNHEGKYREAEDAFEAIIAEAYEQAKRS